MTRRRSLPRADQADVLFFQIQAAGLPEPVREHVFAPVVDGRPVRGWRFDLAYPDPGLMLAMEVDGAILSGGRHGGTPSAARDIEKRLAAAVLGWRVLHFSPALVSSGEALVWIEAALGRREPPLLKSDRSWPVAAARPRSAPRA